MIAENGHYLQGLRTREEGTPENLDTQGRGCCRARAGVSAGVSQAGPGASRETRLFTQL